MSDDPRAGIVKRPLRGRPRSSRALSPVAALERTADDDLRVRLPADEPAKRRPFQSWTRFYDERAASATSTGGEHAPDTWRGRPRLAPIPSPDTPDERLTPSQWDARHGAPRAARPVRRTSKWFDARRAGSRAPTLEEMRGERRMEF